MSSACTCHLNEWCFYCEMYVPLEKERDQLKEQVARLQKVSDAKFVFWNKGDEESRLTMQEENIRLLEENKKLKEHFNGIPIIKELHDDNLRLRKEIAALEAERDDFKHGHIMLQKRNKTMKNYLIELQRVTPYALIREQIGDILAAISKEDTP